MIRIAALIIGIILLMQPAQALYVAPYGLATNDGSADSPKTLGWAMASAPAGSTVWLIPGVYAGSFTATAPGVTYRSEVGTRARLDGNLTISAAGTTWRDLEITNTSWLTRTGTPAQASTVVQVYAPRVELLNNYIHDLGGGVGAFNGPGGATADLTLRGNLIYNNGWGATTAGAGHGHGAYLQNDDAGRKTLDNNIFLPNYGYLVQFYGSSIAHTRHLDMDRNVLVGGRTLLGGGSGLRDIRFRDNLGYGYRFDIGYTSQNSDILFTGNTLAGADLQMRSFSVITATGNTIAWPNRTLITFQKPTGVLTYTWDDNHYYGAAFTDFAYGGITTYANWQAYIGGEQHSTYQASAPSEPWVIVQPNADDSQRRTVAIYNWTGASTVPVSLPGLTPGASYKLINAANPTEYQAFVAGADVDVSMQGWTVAKPYGASAPLSASTAPGFMVFLVEPL